MGSSRQGLFFEASSCQFGSNRNSSSAAAAAAVVVVVREMQMFEMLLFSFCY